MDRLFDRLAMIYGLPKVREMWRDQDIAAVKRFWAQQLAGFNGEQLHFGFDQLRKTHPTWPPTLFEFADLCKAARAPDQPALPAPPRTGAESEQVARLKAAIGQSSLGNGKRDPRAWVARILEREAAGDKTLDYIALKMARDSVLVR
jgi:hypothetical protein